MDDSRSVSRRRFLAASGASFAALAVATPSSAQQGTPAASPAARTPRLRALTRAEARELDAISARFLPSEPGSPGARELGVVPCVDALLAGGFAAMLPDLRSGLSELRRVVGERHAGATSFAALTPAQQDALLAEFEQVDPSKAPNDDMRRRLGARAALFGMALRLTHVGAFADPGYGGNRNKGGWRLMGFVDRHSWAPPFGALDRG